jgi:hypothetical protein
MLYRVVLSFYFFCTRVGSLPPGANPIAVIIIIIIIIIIIHAYFAVLILLQNST